jgi:hypothetical protein
MVVVQRDEIVLDDLKDIGSKGGIEFVFIEVFLPHKFDENFDVIQVEGHSVGSPHLPATILIDGDLFDRDALFASPDDVRVDFRFNFVQELGLVGFERLGKNIKRHFRTAC